MLFRSGHDGVGALVILRTVHVQGQGLAVLGKGVAVGAGREALFCGTLPVIGGFRWAEEFAMELEDPVLKRRITHSYAIHALRVEG